MPVRIRSDNGVPFATQALGRLSALSVWWIRLGILPDLIEPASPQQNGRHERMPRTLKRDWTRPPRHSRRAQQHCFDTWRHEFNTLRPHEALDDATLRARLGAAGRQRVVDNFTWQVAARQTADIYRNAISVHSRG